MAYEVFERPRRRRRSADVTFGELAIGDTFEWPDLPSGSGPITKVDESHYTFLIHGGRAPDGQWPDGTPMTARGTAEPHYPVRKVRRKHGEPR